MPANIQRIRGIAGFGERLGKNMHAVAARRGTVNKNNAASGGRSVRAVVAVGERGAICGSEALQRRHVGEVDGLERVVDACHRRRRLRSAKDDRDG